MLYVCAIYVDCRKILKLFVRALETGRKASPWRSFLTCFEASANEFYFLLTIHLYCVYPAMSKSLKQLSNFTKKSRYRHHSNRLQGYPLSGPCLNCYRFLPFALLELGTRKALLDP